MYLKRLHSHILIGLSLVCAVIIILIYYNFFNLRQAQTNTFTIKNNQEQLRLAQEILIDMQNMETGQRGFVLTGDSSFLKSYQAGLESLAKDTILLFKNLNILKQEKLDENEIMGLVHQKLEHMNQVLLISHQFGIDSGKRIIAQRKGLQIMDALRKQVDHYEIIQQRFLDKIIKQITETDQKTTIQLWILGAVIIVLVFISFYVIKSDYQKINAQNDILSFHSALLTNISDAIISTDMNLTIIDINKKTESMFGCTKTEATGKHLFSVIGNQAASHEINEFIEILKNGKSWRGEFKHLHKNHQELTLDCSSSIIINTKGNKIGTVSVVRDITLQSLTQHQLRGLSKKLETDIAEKIEILTQKNTELIEARERFFLIANATNECLWDWDISSNKIWGNRAYCQLLDKGESEQIDYTEFVERVYEEDNKIITSLFNETIQKKEKHFITTFRFKCSDGTVKDFINKSFIVYDKNGNPKRCLGGLTDITLQNKIQQQIIKEKEISDNLINSLPGIFYLFNKEGKYLRWNKNTIKVSGYAEEEFIKLSPIDFVPKEEQPSLIDKIESVFIKGSDSIEADFLTKDGTRIPYYFTGSRVHIDGEDCLMGVGYDMTEKLAYQQQLKDLALHLQTIREEEQMRISREIHDELGQQLTGLKMQLKLLKKSDQRSYDLLPDKIQEIIDVTDTAIQSVRKISSQLRPSILDDLGLVNAMESLVEETEKKHNISCSFVTNNTSKEIDTHTATALYRILQESITNVIRHSEATKLDVVFHSNDLLLSLAIKDNGKGFDTKIMQTGKTIGLIGLKERAEMIGASSSIISEEGKGTEIVISKKI